LEFIVDTALEFKLGARGLRTICETIMIDAMFDMPSNNDKSIKITIDYAKERLYKINLTGLKAA
jgi:ATP-dependent Clp protease ATP-binding subunit ClpX